MNHLNLMLHAKEEVKEAVRANGYYQKCSVCGNAFHALVNWKGKTYYECAKCHNLLYSVE